MRPGGATSARYRGGGLIPLLAVHKSAPLRGRCLGGFGGRDRRSPAREHLLLLLAVPLPAQNDARAPRQAGGVGRQGPMRVAAETTTYPTPFSPRNDCGGRGRRGSDPLPVPPQVGYRSAPPPPGGAQSRISWGRTADPSRPRAPSGVYAGAGQEEGPRHEVGPARWPQTGGRQPPDAGGRRACAGPTGKCAPPYSLLSLGTAGTPAWNAACNGGELARVRLLPGLVAQPERIDPLVQLL
jgi:hypothetical protein